MYKRGRAPILAGENNGRATLTDDDARRIRSRRNENTKALAREFGVTPKVVRRIKSGETWKSVAVAVALVLMSYNAASAQLASEGDWWRCHHESEPPHVSCCGIGDGHALTDKEWRQTAPYDAANPYQIMVDGKWFNVPKKAVISDGATCGEDPDAPSEAHVWYTRLWSADNVLDLRIMCFIVGQMY